MSWLWSPAQMKSIWVTASIARQEYQVPRIVARIKNPKNAWLYTPEMGWWM